MKRIDERIVGASQYRTPIGSELSLSGITTVGKLMEVGSLNTAARTQAPGFSIRDGKLYALEGALRGIRWHRIPSEERSALWAEFLEQGDVTSD